MKRNYGEALALWLNTITDTDTQKSFCDSIRTMNWSATSNAEGLERQFPDSPILLVGYSPPIFEKARPRFQPSDAVYSAIIEGPSSDPRWGLPNNNVPKQWKLEWYYPEESEPQPGIRFNKGHALTCLIALAEQGRLDRMRECPPCGKWLYARFSHQRFCSTKCQQAHYWSSPEWKAHRREWMRDYRSNPMRGIKESTNLAAKNPGKE